MTFAVVGLGRFGQERLKSLARNSGIADLQYVADVDNDLARRTATSLECRAPGFDDLLRRRDYDVAIVAVPNVYHFDVVNALLDADHDVWCEKPLAPLASQCRSLVERSIARRRILKVGSNVRFFPNVRRISELSSVIGQPSFFRGWIGNNGDHLLNGSWYSKKDLVGGGTLLDNGVHLIDLLRHLFGEIVLCDSCTTMQTRWRFDGLEDNAMAIYRMENGAIAFIHSSWTDPAGYMYFEMYGSSGYIQVDSRHSRACLSYGRHDASVTTEDLTTAPKRSYDLELEDFVFDYNRGVHPSPTSYDGYRALKVIEASYRCAELGGPITTADADELAMFQDLGRAFELRP